MNNTYTPPETIEVMELINRIESIPELTRNQRRILMGHLPLPDCDAAENIEKTIHNLIDIAKRSKRFYSCDYAITKPEPAENRKQEKLKAVRLIHTIVIQESKV